MPGFWWSLISAALAIGAGIILLAKPAQGVLTLTIVIGAYFLAEGVATIMYALEHRRELSERWSWMAFSGVLDILISAMIITGLPGSAEWAIGLLVGINLLFGGASLIGMARAQTRIGSADLVLVLRDDKPECMRYRATMITVATSYYWYFSFDSSLAAGGSRSI
jgi:uncharacterized membrane protein HdeD (DUF308 family)